MVKQDPFSQRFRHSNDLRSLTSRAMEVGITPDKSQSLTMRLSKHTSSQRCEPTNNSLLTTRWSTYLACTFETLRSEWFRLRLCCVRQTPLCTHTHKIEYENKTMRLPTVRNTYASTRACQVPKV